MNATVAFIQHNYNKYSISSLAGALEGTLEMHADVYFLDGKKPSRLIKDLSALAREHEVLLVCFSFATTNIIEVYKALNIFKTGLNSSNIIYIAGGPHATGDPEGTLSLGFDIVFIGEAEESFPGLVQKLAIGKNWQEIEGIAYKQNRAVVKTGKRRPVDLNCFAPFSIKHRKLSPIEISRGCPHACRFCQTSFIFGGKMRHRNIDEILKYITLSKQNGTRDFRFISPNALAYGSEDGKTVNLAAIETLLRESSKITGKGHLFFGSFPSEVRPENVSDDTLQLITRYTATKQLVVGAQSGSQKMLDSLHRQHTVEDVYRAVKLILDVGLEVCVDFIFGLPGETKEDCELSVKMIDEFARLGVKIHSHTFIPLPGTPLVNEEAGVVDEELARYLSRLANKGLQFGQWKTQQKTAKEVSAFMGRA